MTVASLLADMIIIVAVPLNWVVAGLLWRLSYRVPDASVLRDRAIAATAVALTVTIFAFVFINNDLDDPIFAAPEIKLLARGAMLVLSIIPALLWLRLYFRTRND